MCSSQNDEDCANIKRPDPARTCHLQPCATWQSGSWSKVSMVDFLQSLSLMRTNSKVNYASRVIIIVDMTCNFSTWCVSFAVFTFHAVLAIHLLCCDTLQCPDNCVVVGKRHREVQCVDSQSHRPLRPFHCQAVSSRPISTLTCPNKPCMTWITSPWGPV